MELKEQIEAWSAKERVPEGYTPPTVEERIEVWQEQERQPPTEPLPISPLPAIKIPGEAIVVAPQVTAAPTYGEAGVVPSSTFMVPLSEEKPGEEGYGPEDWHPGMPAPPGWEIDPDNPNAIRRIPELLVPTGLEVAPGLELRGSPTAQEAYLNGVLIWTMSPDGEKQLTPEFQAAWLAAWERYQADVGVGNKSVAEFLAEELNIPLETAERLSSEIQAPAPYYGLKPQLDYSTQASIQQAESSIAELQPQVSTLQSQYEALFLQVNQMFDPGTTDLTRDYSTYLWNPDGTPTEAYQRILNDPALMEQLQTLIQQRDFAYSQWSQLSNYLVGLQETVTNLKEDRYWNAEKGIWEVIEGYSAEQIAALTSYRGELTTSVRGGLAGIETVSAFATPGLSSYVKPDGSFDLPAAVAAGVSEKTLNLMGFSTKAIEVAKASNEVKALLGHAPKSYEDIAKVIAAGLEADLRAMGFSDDDLTKAENYKYLMDNGYLSPDGSMTPEQIEAAIKAGVPSTYLTGLGIMTEEDYYKAVKTYEILGKLESVKAFTESREGVVVNETSYDLVTAVLNGLATEEELRSIFGDEAVDAAVAQVEVIKAQQVILDKLGEAASYPGGEGTEPSYDLVTAILKGLATEEELVSIFGQEAVDAARAQADASILTPDGIVVTTADLGGMPEDLRDILLGVGYGAYSAEIEAREATLNKLVELDIIGEDGTITEAGMNKALESGITAAQLAAIGITPEAFVTPPPSTEQIIGTGPSGETLVFVPPTLGYGEGTTPPITLEQALDPIGSYAGIGAGLVYAGMLASPDYVPTYGEYAGMHPEMTVGEQHSSYEKLYGKVKLSSGIFGTGGFEGYEYENLPTRAKESGFLEKPVKPPIPVSKPEVIPNVLTGEKGGAKYEEVAPAVSLQTFQAQFLQQVESFRPKDKGKAQAWEELMMGIAQDEYTRLYGKGATISSVGVQLGTMAFQPIRVLNPEVEFKDIKGWEWALGAVQIAAMTAPLWTPALGKALSWVGGKLHFTGKVPAGVTSTQLSSAVSKVESASLKIGEAQGALKGATTTIGKTIAEGELKAAQAELNAAASSLEKLVGPGKLTLAQETSSQFLGKMQAVTEQYAIQPTLGGLPMKYWGRITGESGFGEVAVLMDPYYFQPAPPGIKFPTSMGAEPGIPSVELFPTWKGPLYGELLPFKLQKIPPYLGFKEPISPRVGLGGGGRVLTLPKVLPIVGGGVSVALPSTTTMTVEQLAKLMGPVPVIGIGSIPLPHITIPTPSIAPTTIPVTAPVTVPVTVPKTAPEVAPIVVPGVTPKTTPISVPKPGIVPGPTPGVTVPSLIPGIVTGVTPIEFPGITPIEFPGIKPYIPEPVLPVPPLVETIPPPPPLPGEEPPPKPPPLFPKIGLPEFGGGLSLGKKRKRPLKGKGWLFPGLEIVFQQPLTMEEVRRPIAGKRIRKYGAGEPVATTLARGLRA